MFVHTADVARQIDKKAIETIGIPSMVLMEHAAIQVSAIITEKYSVHDSIAIVCGPGNNGGDGLAIARLLKEKGYDVDVCIISQHLSKDEELQRNILNQLDIPIFHTLQRPHYDVIVDCIFGNGLSRPVEGKYRDVIIEINQRSSQVVSVDVPSGLDATTGRILGCCINATLTIALDCYKQGHLLHQGPDVVGELIGVDIGIPSQLHPAQSQWIDKDVACLPSRPKNSHKGTYGKCLMIGGSQSMHGAITLAANACYRSGVGTLTLMIPDSIGDILASKMDFAMQLRMPDRGGFFSEESIPMIKEKINDFEFISIGNGIGRTETTKKIVEIILESDKPVILDADAFWNIKDQTELLNRKYPTICTPHVKELSLLLDCSTSSIVEDPFQATEDFCNKYPNVTLVLKSNVTIVSKHHKSYVLYAPNSGLSKGGSGDILCGIIAGLYGQSKETVQSCITGVFVHSQAAKQNKDPMALLPDDIIENLDATYKKLR